MHELPYKTTLEDVSVLCHERNEGDAPQEWLRATLSRAIEPLRARLFEFARPARPALSPSVQRLAAEA
jgi:hypothetical protein